MDDQPPRSYVPPPPAPPAPAAEEARPAPPPETPVAPPPDDARPRRGRGVLRYAIYLLLLVIVVGLIVWYALHAGSQGGGNTGRFTSAGPMPIGTATVQQGNMPINDNALGTVTPLATVTVKTQINGQLTEVAFQEGQMVNKGDFLAQIDPRPYQVALEQAQGQLAKDQASLADAELDLARYTKLVAQNSLASQQLDTQRALVQQDKGTVISDQAQVDVQKLNLIYCHIIAPSPGRVGLRQVDAGNYVQTSDASGIVVITQLQPISVIFTLPEDSLPAVLARVHAGATLQAVAFDRSGTKQLEIGQLATIDNQIDPTTGTVKLRAQFPNAQLNLFPNQFVNIQLLVDTMQNIPIVPSSAIQRGAPGTFVYVVNADNTVTATPVTLGPDNGEQVAVIKGLTVGQIIVTDGADRLKDGAKVQVVTPAAQPPGQTPAEPKPKGQGGGGQGQRRSGGG